MVSHGADCPFLPCTRPGAAVYYYSTPCWTRHDGSDPSLSLGHFPEGSARGVPSLHVSEEALFNE